MGQALSQRRPSWVQCLMRVVGPEVGGDRIPWAHVDIAGPSFNEQAPRGVAPKVAFVFPGTGGQWSGMGATLARREPSFRLAIEACADAQV